MDKHAGEERREVSGGWDPRLGNMIHRGLDLSNPTVTTPEEVAAFKKHYETQMGTALSGLDWWFDRNPEVLKRYRLFCSLTLRVKPAPMGNGTTGFYMLMGYETGIRYTIHSYMNDGYNRAQIFEALALAFIHAGPRGMQATATALDGMEFNPDPQPPAKFPDGWAPDLAAFQSGIDHGSPMLLAGEREKIEAWYMNLIGEIPGHVTFLANHAPALLKTHRSRMENMLYELPKQCWPTTMLYYNVMSRCAEGIRENVQLCKAWGVSKEDTLATITNALVYGQMEAATMVQEKAGDVLDAWVA